MNKIHSLPRITILAILACLVAGLESAAAADTPLDLSKAANMGFADEKAGDGKGGWSDQGQENDLRGFDISRRNFGGVDFSIVDPAKNGGKAVLTLNSQYARTGLNETKINLSQELPAANFLYLLHTSCFNQEPQGSAIGTIEVIFEDGSKTEKAVKSGIDLSDWWNPGPMQNAKVVYTQLNKGSTVGIYLSRFDLDKTPKRIKSIALKTNGKVVWIVLGATLSTRAVEIEGKKIVIAPGNDWKAVDLSDIQVKKGSALDLSAIYEPGPAGKHGRLIVAKNGGLAFEDSPDVERKFNGFNYLGMILRGISLDKKSKAENTADIVNVATLIKRHGYNMVRPSFDGFLVRGAAKDCVFNPDSLDYIDRLMAELKANGVYTYLTIGWYTMGRIDWKQGWDERNLDKMKMYLGDPEVKERWRKITENLLNHVNPYTGIAWKDDPAIACLEFYNEQCQGKYWNRFSKLPKDTLALLNSKWRSWVLQKYKTCQGVADAWGEKKYSSPEVFEKLEWPSTWDAGVKATDFTLFFGDLARAEVAWCESVVRAAGYKGLITQFGNEEVNDLAVVWENADFVSPHTYFAHPSEQFVLGGKCEQSSSVGSSASYWKNSISGTHFADRPLIVGEYNQMFWNQYQHECGLLFASYSALQGFSSLMVHDDPVSVRNITSEKTSWTWNARNPVVRANEFLSCCLFGRGDVKRAEHRVELQIPAEYLKTKNQGRFAINPEQSSISLMTGFGLTFPDLKRPERLQSKLAPADMVISPQGHALIKYGDWSATVSASKDAAFSLRDFVAAMKVKGILPASNLSNPDTGVYQSDTGEITMRTKENLIKVITQRTEGVSLEANKSEKLALLSVNGSTIPAAIAVSSIDGNPLTASSRMVLIYNTEMGFAGMELSADRVTILNHGNFPVLMRPGKLELTLKCKDPAKMSLYALRIDGTRQEKLPVVVDGDMLKISIDTATLKNGNTPFFELVAE